MDGSNFNRRIAPPFRLFSLLSNPCVAKKKPFKKNKKTYIWSFLSVWESGRELINIRCIFMIRFRSFRIVIDLKKPLRSATRNLLVLRIIFFDFLPTYIAFLVKTNFGWWLDSYIYTKSVTCETGTRITLLCLSHSNVETYFECGDVF